jgi:subtilisin family serine protease
MHLRRRLGAVVFASVVVAVPAVVGSSGTSASGLPAASGGDTYLVVFNGSSVPANAAQSVTAAGGSVVASYGAIGVLVARASSASFATTLRNAKGVDGVSATAAFATKLNDDTTDKATAPTPGTPATDSDSLSGLQWDMVQIHTPEAHAITGGSPSVVVGDIDTGLDFTHPDLAANVDFADSASCVGGVANQAPSAWMDDNGHGTHTAGTIAAASNGIGIVGVAPNVRIAGIKAGNADGFFFPEAVVCAFMWAGSHHIPITNNSYFADPWLYNCKNDPDQRAIWKAERRAISYAQQQGDLVVAAAGNEADDLAHPTLDATSPDDSTPVLRTIHNDCAVIPVEVAGVVGVSANGNLQLKSFYSSYGSGSVQVVAPGGDSILQLTAAAPNGRVLSTWPASLINTTCLPGRSVIDASGATYCYQQGTSMASPHAAGVAALIASTGVNSPNAIAARLTGTADSIPCPPDLSIYSFFPSVNNGAPQTCNGGKGYNSFNGKGQINALAALK